ncbi:conjugal transfer protein TraG N-terminal domain-containing protein [Providencia sp. PROV236]|uniref:conjugal transfer protein TraG N-terminal domain-containing protein n=1 Tax=Providencia sp. PROV236 TaxID=2936798 RepID=UPI0034E19E3F
MDFHVYTSSGGASALSMVFNGLSMLSNDGVLAGSFKIAFLLSIIGYVIKSAADGGKTIAFQQAAVSVVLFLCFFQVTTRVTIEDVTTGEVRAVDNVPFGVGFTASIISNTGYQFTRKMEQAFSMPSMTENGPVDPLYTLASMFDAMRDPLIWSSGDSKSAHLEEAIKVYTNQCLAFDIARGAQSFMGIMNKPFDDQLATSPNRTIAIEVNGKVDDVSCLEAMKSIRLMVGGQADSIGKGVLSVRNGFSEKCKTYGSKNQCSLPFANKTMTEAMTFFGATGKNLRDFQAQLLMYPFVVNMPQTANENAYHSYAAVAKSQSQIQQSFKWASEGSSFLIWIQYLQSFIQAAVYGLVPFVAFALAFGLMGVGLSLKYVLVLLWIQTWQPLLAIMNAIMLTKTQSDISVLVSGASSFSDLYHLLFVTQKNIAIAGHMMASVPMLGAFVVFGSSYAFTGLTKGLSTTGAPDTSPMTPDATDSPALHKQSAVTEQSAHNAVSTITGGNSTAPKLDLSNTRQQAIQSASSRNITAQETLTSAIDKGVSSLSSMGINTSHNYGSTINSDTGLSNTVSNSSNSGSMLTTGNTSSTIDESAKITALSGDASVSGGMGVGSPETGGAGGKGVSIGGSTAVSAQSSDIHRNSGAQTTGIMTNDSVATNDATSVSNNIQFAEHIADQLDKHGGTQETAQLAQSIRQAASQAETAQESYSDTVSANNSVSTKQSYTAGQVATLANENSNVIDKINNENLSNDEFQNRKKEYQQQLSSIMGASDAESAATIYAANDTGGLANHFGELFGPATNPTGAMNGEESRNMNVAQNTETKVQENIVNNQGAVNTKFVNTTAQAQQYLNSQQANIEDESAKNNAGLGMAEHYSESRRAREQLHGSSVSENSSRIISNEGTSVATSMNALTNSVSNVGADQNNIESDTTANLNSMKSVNAATMPYEQSNNITDGLAKYAAIAKNSTSINQINEAATNFANTYYENGGNGNQIPQRSRRDIITGTDLSPSSIPEKPEKSEGSGEDKAIITKGNPMPRVEQIKPR